MYIYFAMINNKKKNIPKIILDINDINWKNVTLLNSFIDRFGNIKPRKFSGNSVKFQKHIREQIIRARELWLIGFAK